MYRALALGDMPIFNMIATIVHRLGYIFWVFSNFASEKYVPWCDVKGNLLLENMWIGMKFVSDGFIENMSNIQLGNKIMTVILETPPKSKPIYAWELSQPNALNDIMD